VLLGYVLHVLKIAQISGTTTLSLPNLILFDILKYFRQKHNNQLPD
jgi:hypothetical protein